MSRCGLIFLTLATCLGPALGQDSVVGEVTYDRYGANSELTYLETAGGRLELRGDSVQELRRFRAPDLGVGSDVALQVELSGRLDGARFHVETVTSPQPIEAIVRVERDGQTIHAIVESQRLRALGPFAADVLLRVEGEHATVRGFKFERQQVLFVETVRAVVASRARLYRTIGIVTVTKDIPSGRVSAGTVLWVKGNSVGSLYLAGDAKERFVRDTQRLNLITASPEAANGGAGFSGVVSGD